MRTIDGIISPIILGFVMIGMALAFNSRLLAFYQSKPWVFCAWMLWAVAFLLLLHFSFRHPAESNRSELSASDRLEAPNVGQKPEGALSPQQTIIEANRVRGYGKAEWIPSRDDDGEVDSSLPQIALQRKAGPKSTEGMISEDIVTTKPSGEMLEFNYVLLFNDKSWKANSHSLFEGESPSGIGPDKVLKNRAIQQDIKRARRLICVGLASTEFKVDQAHSNTVLSDNRAIYLCNTLYRMGFVQEGSPSQSTLAMGLGEYVPTPDDETSNILQRSVILMSIAQMNDESDYELFDALRASVASNKIKLANYKRDDGLLLRLFGVRNQFFTDATSDSWLSEESGFFIRDGHAH